MICYECPSRGETRSAVALCHHGSVALVCGARAGSQRSRNRPIPGLQDGDSSSPGTAVPLQHLPRSDAANN